MIRRVRAAVNAGELTVGMPRALELKRHMEGAAALGWRGEHVPDNS